MNTLKIIEGQEKDFEDKFVENGGVMPRHRDFGQTLKRDLFNWHKQSIIQILQSEIERKRGMKKEYTESFHVDEVEKNQAVKYKNHGEVGFNRCLKEDIAHLQGLLDSLK